jgi:hypothetical protein
VVPLRLGKALEPAHHKYHEDQGGPNHDASCHLPPPGNAVARVLKAAVVT